MQTFEVKDHEPSFLPSGIKWKLVWSDEFDGTELDRSKWDFRLNFWGKPFSGYTDRGIVLDGRSCVEFHRVEKDGLYASPQLQTGSNSFDIPCDEQADGLPTGAAAAPKIWKLGKLSPAKFVHRFGYYECRCRFQKYPEDMWSAFWLQSPSIGTSYDPAWCGVESDIMECFKSGEITVGNIMGGYGEHLRNEGRVHGIRLRETPDGFQRFGLLWTSREYVFYCDGEEVSRAWRDVSQVPQFILLTTEVVGHRHGNGLKVNGEFVDDFFTADYVRIFDEVE